MIRKCQELYFCVHPPLPRYRIMFIESVVNIERHSRINKYYWSRFAFHRLTECPFSFQVQVSLLIKYKGVGELGKRISFIQLRSHTHKKDVINKTSISIFTISYVNRKYALTSDRYSKSIRITSMYLNNLVTYTLRLGLFKSINFLHKICL